jgi:NADH-quinone oxidoreductase subunit E
MPAARQAEQEAKAAAAQAPDTDAARVKPTTHLAGQEDLAARKGTWKYAKAAPAKTVAKEEMVDPSAATKPETLTAARDGGADDLKQIKGIGPKLESVCNALGVYHFDQIAKWTAAEVAWMDDNLEGFKGRVSRDNWVEQAKTLASGDETEFSSRVKKGDVYDE